MNVLYYCLHRPKGLSGRVSGPTRSAGAALTALESVGVSATVMDVDEYRTDEAIRLENACDIIHCNNAQIMTHMLQRGRIPDVVGAHPYAPSKFYRDLGGFYRYPGYESDPDLLYDDAVWVRNNFQEERFNPKLLKKIRIVQPSLEVEQIKPCADFPYSRRKYILWAGSKKRFEKNWPLMEEIIAQMRLPTGYEWKILEDYTLEEYYKTLDETALMVYTSKFESFGYQLFESWAKATPTIYLSSLWGAFPFHGCGGLPVTAEEYTPQGFCTKLNEFFQMSLNDRENLGAISRMEVARDFSPQRQGREFKLIYSQILASRA